jgi:hypothetical protein
VLVLAARLIVLRWAELLKTAAQRDSETRRDSAAELEHC